MLEVFDAERVGILSVRSDLVNPSDLSAQSLLDPYSIVSFRSCDAFIALTSGQECLDDPRVALQELQVEGTGIAFQ